MRRDVWGMCACARGMREGNNLHRGVSNGTTAIPLPWTTIRT